MTMMVVTAWLSTGNYLPFHRVHSLKLFDIPNTVPPLEALRVPARTLIGSMLFSAIRGYCIVA